MIERLRRETTCRTCEETPTVGEHKGDDVLRCEDCGRILVRV
jgi:ribosomal protein S27E